MMNKTKNQASIVFEILNKVSSMEDSTTMQQAWSGALNYDLGDLQKISSVPAILIDNLKNIELELGEISHIQDLNAYYKPIRTIINAIFNTHYSDDIKNFKNNIRNQMPGLSICSDILNSNNVNEKIISTEEIDELRSKAEELINDILSAEIEEDVKLIFIDIINQFKHATIMYQLKGAVALREAFCKNLGSLVLNSSTISVYDESSNEKKIRSKVLEYMEKVNTIVGFVANTQNAIPYIVELIKN